MTNVQWLISQKLMIEIILVCYVVKVGKLIYQDRSLLLQKLQVKTILSLHLMEGYWVKNVMLRMECNKEVYHLGYYFYYLQELVSDISKLPARYTLICSKYNILGYADELVIVASTGKVLQLLLNAFTFKLYTLSLQVKVQKSSNFVFRHSV